MRQRRLLRRVFALTVCMSLLMGVGSTSASPEGDERNESPETSYIYLKADTFDPLQENPDIPEELMLNESQGFYLVQFKNRTLQEWTDAIENIGGTFHGYVPDNAYMIEMEESEKEQAENLPFVRWIGLFHPGYKIDPALTNSSGVMDLVVLVFRDLADSLPNVTAEIEALGGLVTHINEARAFIHVEIDSSKIGGMAHIPEVEWIGITSPPTAYMNNVRSDTFTGADQLYINGYRGDGIIGGIQDTGIDELHEQYADRLIIDGIYSTTDHGTRVFGIIFASGSPDDNARGMLPEAVGVFKNWETAWGYRYSSAERLASMGGVFTSYSVGNALSDRLYGQESKEMDDIVFDFDMTQAQAMGNFGEGTGAREAMAKNVISVGALMHYDDADRTNDKWAADPPDRTFPASTGPTEPVETDGRVKPDLVGPYDDIYTTDLNNGYFDDFGGTSAATPIVAGAAGLVYQMYKEDHFGNNPSGDVPHAATVKALLIANAYQYEIRWGPNQQATRYQQGWGVPDLKYMYDTGVNHFIVDQYASLAKDETTTYQVYALGTQPLKISLVWTDYPAAPGASKALVNDLDITITDPSGTEYKGNYGLVPRELLLPQKWSRPGGERDDRNNVENVFIESPQVGMWTIQVSANAVNEDGDPNSPGLKDQHFALVASGVEPSPVIALEDGADKVAHDVVRLTIVGSDVDEMRFSNDGSDWSDWEDYSTSKFPWLLEPGLGARGVHVEVKDASGTTKKLGQLGTVVQYWDDKVDVSRIDRGSYAGRGSVALDPQLAVDMASGKLYAVWHEVDAVSVRRVYFSMSSDDGESWTNPVPVVLSPVGDMGWPDVAVGDGWIYVVWQQQVAGTWDLFYSKSSDGISWQPPMPIPHPLLGDQIRPRIARGLTSSGNLALHVVYEDWDLGISQVYYQRYDAPADTWDATPVWISDFPSGSSFSPVVESNWQDPSQPGKFVHVGFTYESFGSSQIMYKRHLDYGDLSISNWDIIQSLDPSGNDQDNPELSVYHENVYVVWDEHIDSNRRIRFTSSDVNGGSVSWRLSPETLSTLPDESIGIDATKPSVGSDSGGNLAVAWQDNRLGNMEVYVARHYSYGVKFSAWEHWGRITFPGYHKKDATSPVISFGASNQVNLLWQDENWGIGEEDEKGWDVRYLRDVTDRGTDPGFNFRPPAGVVASITSSDPAGGNPKARTYQERIAPMNLGSWEPLQIGGQCWNRHRLIEGWRTEPTDAGLEAIYRYSIPHARGHEVSPGTSYTFTVYATTTSTTDLFRFYWRYDETDSWNPMSSIVIDLSTTGPQVHLFTQDFDHHGFIYVKVEDENLMGPNNDPVLDTLIVSGEIFEDIDGAMWLSAEFPAGAIESDLTVTWSVSPDDTGPGGLVAGYDVYMADNHYDSYYVHIDSVPAGTNQYVVKGAAITGLPEVIHEGPNTGRYSPNFYFRVGARDSSGRMALSLSNHAGRYTIEMTVEETLLSLPYATQATSTPIVFAPIEGHWKRVAWYDASDQYDPWKEYTTYMPPPSNDLLDVNREMGLWVRLEADSNGHLYTGLFPVVGRIPSYTDIQLITSASGPWNLVGYPYAIHGFHTPYRPLTVAEALAGIDYVTVETYDPESPPYYLKELSDEDPMLPGLGYWIQVNSQAIWRIDNDFPHEANVI